MPRELPSVEEAPLKLLAAAMNALQMPSLSKAEIARLRPKVQAVKTYKEPLADYINCSQIEAKLLKMEQKYADLSAKVQQTQAKNSQAANNKTIAKLKKSVKDQV